MGKKYNKTKKSQQELHIYRNRVKYKTDLEETDNNKTYIKDLQGTNETIDEESYLSKYKEEMDIQKPPLVYRAKEFFESHFTELLIAAILGLAGWSINLQIGQAVQGNIIQSIDEDIKEIRTIIEDKYIKKDIYDIQIETLKDKIKNIEDEIKELKRQK